MVVCMGGSSQAHEDEERYSCVHVPGPESHKIKDRDGKSQPERI